MPPDTRQDLEPIYAALRQVRQQAKQEFRTPVLWRLHKATHETFARAGLAGDMFYGIRVDMTSGPEHLQCEDGTQIPI